jgi:hypothetical protein
MTPHPCEHLYRVLLIKLSLRAVGAGRWSLSVPGEVIEQSNC